MTETLERKNRRALARDAIADWANYVQFGSHVPELRVKSPSIEPRIRGAEPEWCPSSDWMTEEKVHEIHRLYGTLTVRDQRVVWDEWVNKGMIADLIAVEEELGGRQVAAIASDRFRLRFLSFVRGAAECFVVLPAYRIALLALEPPGGKLTHGKCWNALSVAYQLLDDIESDMDKIPDPTDDQRKELRCARQKRGELLGMMGRTVQGFRQPQEGRKPVAELAAKMAARRGLSRRRWDSINLEFADKVASTI